MDDFYNEQIQEVAGFGEHAMFTLKRNLIGVFLDPMPGRLAMPSPESHFRPVDPQSEDTKSQVCDEMWLQARRLYAHCEDQKSRASSFCLVDNTFSVALAGRRGRRTRLLFW